ncbi:hypothetical protein FLB_11380 [Flavobacterium succinicans]|uniref:Uncharacterized protein n=1 Tax=Flavobacterium succinicans TaxID=29536 RepID=A0A199XR77_9FLAO|nr:hypothetical protein FLB_11380 [Flavobacterium succinicans]
MYRFQMIFNHIDEIYLLVVTYGMPRQFALLGSQHKV